MIAKMIKGRGFRGVLDYALHPDKGYMLCSNMAGQTPRELATEFGQIRNLRPNLKKVVCHVSIALMPSESLTDDEWRDVADEYLQQMGFANSQYVAVKHTGTEHPHIHLIINRIDIDGQVVSDSHDYKRQEKVMRGLEQKYNLTQVPDSRMVDKKAYTKKEIERVVRTGEPSVKMQLHNIIDDALQKSIELYDFIGNLALNNVETHLNQASTGTISGISFAINGVAVKGSDLGKGYSWRGLQAKGLYNGAKAEFSQEYQQYKHKQNEGERKYEQSGTGQEHSRGDFISEISQERVGENTSTSRSYQEYRDLERFYQELREGNISKNQRNGRPARKRSR